MKSAELRAKTVPTEQADNWLQSIRAEQVESLSAAFSHQALKRRADLSVAFTVGVLLGLAGHALAFFSLIYSVYALGLVSTVGVVVSLVYIRASVRAFLASTEYQRRASSSIRIVHDDVPIENPKIETASPPPPN
jgi:hypothetical protein